MQQFTGFVSMSTLISYAQNFEDVMLWRALGHIQNGFYIDIGAQDPIIDSISFSFYERAWRGVHVEPTPAYAQALRDARPDETVVQAAIGNEAELIPFYEIPNTGISTGVAEIATRHEAAGFPIKRTEVPCIKLSALLDNYKDRDVHWLKIDVEGMELNVLQSWAPSRVRPWVVVVESTLPLSIERSHSAWESIILGLGYRFAYFDGLNRFYVSKLHRDLLAAFETPPNVFDSFALSGTGSHTFCTQLRNALAQTHSDIEHLKSLQKELEDQLVLAQHDDGARAHAAELERRIAELTGEAERSTQEAVTQSDRINQALHQAAQAKDEALQLLQRLEVKGDAHAMAVANAHEESTRLRQSLTERERLIGEIRVQMALLQADATSKQDALEQQQRNAKARLSEMEQLRDTALTHAHRLESEINVLADQATANQEEFAHLQQTLTERQQRIAELEVQLTATQSEASSLRIELLQLRDETQARLAQMEQARDRAKLHLSELQVANDANAKEAAVNREESIRLQQAVAQQDKFIAEVNLQLAKAQADLLRLQADLLQQQQVAQTQLAQQEEAFNSALETLHSERIESELLRNREASGLREKLTDIENSCREREHAWQLLSDKLETELREQLAAERSINSQLLQTVNHLRRNLVEAQASLLIRLQRKWLKRSATLGEAPPLENIPSSADLPRPLGGLATSDIGTAQQNDGFLGSASTPNSHAFPMNPPPAQKMAPHMTEEFPSMSDDAFVANAYRVFLGREPDPAGLKNYVDHLRAGTPKEEILASIARSPECLARMSDISRLYKAAQIGQSENAVAQSAPKIEILGKESRTAETFRELLEHQDESFVVCAYRTLLNREPDPSGWQNYLDKVREGVAKPQIAVEIARSPEGRTKAVLLPGLDEAMQRYRRRLPSLMGFLFNRAASKALGPLEMQVRSLENLVHRLADQSAKRSSRIELAVSEVVSHLISVTKTLKSFEPQIGVRVRPRTPARPHLDDSRRLTRKIYYYVDHTIACPTNTGMQRVARRLADALVKAGESITFVKWDPVQKQLSLVNRDELRYLSKWNGPKVSEAELHRYPDGTAMAVTVKSHDELEPGWLLVPEVTHITYQARPMTLDVLECAKNIGLKSAFIFYDATPLYRPELKPMADAHATYMQLLLLADLVLPISNWVSADLSSFLRLDQLSTTGPTPHIQPIPLPGESHLAARVKITEASGSGTPYVLSVGSIVPHKNQMTLVRAFDRYCKRHPATTWQLKLAGNLHPALSGELQSMSAKNPRIVYLGEVEDDELVRLYKSCVFTAFPSVMEGFGLPILESLWFGKPCICANFGAMAEVAAGGGCLTVDTAQVDDLTGAIEALISEPDRLADLESAARARHIDSWQHYATKLVSAVASISSPLARLGHIYYWVDHTASYDGNTGIQRVTRALARSLQNQGARLIPVRWSSEEHRLIPATEDDLCHLEKWNGPKANLWTDWKPLDRVTPLDWLLVPEVTHFHTEEIRQFGKSSGLRCAWVFYDCIPWKMTDIYPAEATAAHRDYMISLCGVEKVLAISKFSRDDLTSFLTGAKVRAGEVHRRVDSCVLPGEFLESERVLVAKARRSEGPVRILSVGTVEPRKNHLRLLEAMKIVSKNSRVPVELVIAGGAPFPQLAEQVQALVDSIPGVRWIRRIDDAGLQELYRNCDFTVYPSVEEGFGLPILESLWNARPCICASFGAMREVADGGGCLMVDVRDTQQLANGLYELVDDSEMLEELGQEALSRQFKTWEDYGGEVLQQLADERVHVGPIGTPSAITTVDQLREAMPNLARRPLLSICISTYNRAAWLSVNLRNLERLWPNADADVELLVCDNTSTDDTPAVVQPYLRRSDFTYVRNPENVGMLGNLRVTAHRARGKYIWILGDDDLVLPGTIERVLAALRANDGIALVYLNYAYTRNDKAEEVDDLDRFLAESTPIGSTGADAIGTVRDMCVKSENFFTAIYCLVFRRDHAIHAYSQDTSGRPFSTMLTCIPTTHHVLNHMMDEPAYWMGQPQLVVNLNVSWMRYAPLWILERLPDAFDVAERYGGDSALIDRWRVHLVPHVQHWLKELLAADPEGNAQYVSMQRLVNRFKHLEEFQAAAGDIRQLYERAHQDRHPLAAAPADTLFSVFN